MSLLARARPDLAEFRAYVSARSSGLDARIRLNANESPWSVEGNSDGCNRYPDPQPAALRAHLAALYGVDASRVWIGRGSDEAIDLLLRGFCRAGVDNVVTLAPTFGMYRVGAQIQGAECRALALDANAGFALDPERVLALTDENTKLVFLCSPNNPTGTLYHDTLERLAVRLRDRALLVVDEAYIEFSGAPSATALIDGHENVVVLRTLSKAHALAGARIGALIAREEIVAFVRRIAAPYPLAAPCVDLALAALQPDALRNADRRVSMLLGERERVAGALSRLPCVREIWPSSANFVLARFDDAHAALRRTLDAGIVVRDFSSEPGLANCLRITIGAREENDALIAALADERAPASGSPSRSNDFALTGDAP